MGIIATLVLGKSKIMKRKINQSLKEWKVKHDKKPLILKGARQVGKTFSLKKFAKENYQKAHYFNFETEPALAEFFENSFTVKNIIKNLSLYSGLPIDSKEDLIIFDEIQACPRALSSLKYFAENETLYNLVCAGSLLGVNLSSETFPVGKVEYLFLGPMSFYEFLEGIEDNKALKYLEQILEEGVSSQIAHQVLWSRLLDYFVTGGLPEVVSHFANEKAEGREVEVFNQVREIQKSLIRDYRSDFTKHSGKINSLHLQTIFENIPRQLASYIDENTKRYKFKDVLPKKKGFSVLEGPISWLEKAGLIQKVSICNFSELPLKAFTKSNLFKLYIFDIGVLGTILELSPQTIIQQDYGITKGYFAENYVAQALKKDDFNSLHSWSEGTAEIEFLIERAGQIIPLEVKSGNNVKAKSLASYKNRYDPRESYILSGKPYTGNSADSKRKKPFLIKKRAPGVHAFPLYLAEFL